MNKKKEKQKTGGNKNWWEKEENGLNKWKTSGEKRKKNGLNKWKTSEKSGRTSINKHKTMKQEKLVKKGNTSDKEEQ